MGMADMAVVLWSRFLRIDPKNPTWENRDRFVLSAGHASMLLYSMLHLSGFPISIEDIKKFRQWGSVTAGHPELDPSHGIELTTGPLGQGFATGVGMAIAETHLNDKFGDELVDHRFQIAAHDAERRAQFVSWSIIAPMGWFPTVTSWRVSLPKRPRWQGTSGLAS